MNTLIDLFLNLNEHLNELVAAYGAWSYAILFAVILCETGLVATPFVPGESLIFAAGALSVSGVLEPWLLCLVFTAAAFLGNLIGYGLGHLLSERVKHNGRVPFVNPRRLAKTEAFFERHGAMAVILSRFVPFVRSLAPFFAGLGRMPFRRFMLHSMTGAIIWVGLSVWGGHLFGQMPAVKDNFAWVLLAIIAISILPLIVSGLRSRRPRESA